MCYICDVCGVVVQPGLSRKTYAVLRPDGSIEREVAVCRSCLAELQEMDREAHLARKMVELADNVVDRANRLVQPPRQPLVRGLVVPTPVYYDPATFGLVRPAPAPAKPPAKAPPGAPSNGHGGNGKTARK